MGCMFDQLILCFTAPARGPISRLDLDFLSMHVQQMQLHVSKGRGDGLAAPTLNL